MGGTSPELEHALRVLFGLPNEIEKHGYPCKLKVPTMAHLSCFSPELGREGLHLDHNAPKGSSSSGGRELSLVLFLSPGWMKETGGELRAYMEVDDDRPSARPRCANLRIGVKDSSADETDDKALEEAVQDGESDAVQDHFKDYEPEAGRCLIFRSKELWHEVLPSRRMQFALTLFVQSAE